MKRGESLSFLVGTISNILVMEIGWTDVGSGGYILVSCAHSNTSIFFKTNLQVLLERRSKSEDNESDPLVWTNERVIKWVQSIDLEVIND